MNKIKPYVPAFMSNEEAGDGNEFFGQVDRETLN